MIHQNNRGLSQSLNHGLNLCQTKYIARLDADDICHPQRFAKQIEYLEQHPGVGLLGTQIRRMGACGTDGGSNLPMDHEQIVDALLKGEHAICHPTIMCRREAFLQVGEYTECIGEDWDMYLRLAEICQLANHQDCLLDYRFHAGSINGAKMSEMRQRIRFHCFNAARRNAQQAEISFADFCLLETGKGGWWNLRQRVEDHSRVRYHAAIADLLGGHRFRGWARLYGAALTAPHLACKRLARRLRGAKSTGLP